MHPISDVESLLAAQEAEYGKWVAKVAIFVDGVRAFNPGHPVPASHVEAYGYDKDGLVELADGSDHIEEITATSPQPPQGDPIIITPATNDPR